MVEIPIHRGGGEERGDRAHCLRSALHPAQEGRRPVVPPGPGQLGLNGLRNLV